MTPSISRRILARIPRVIRRPIRAIFGSEVTHVIMAGFIVGAMGYIGVLSENARAELISNISVLV